MGWREVRRLMCTGHPTQVWRNLCKKEEEDFFFLSLQLRFRLQLFSGIKGEQGAIYFFLTEIKIGQNHRTTEKRKYTSTLIYG